MKAEIRDKTVLASLRPLEVAAYLRAGGWTQQRASNVSSVWTRDLDYEVELPLARELRDFAMRMGDVLRTLEVVEGRSQLEIYADLSTTSADVIRVRASESESADGTISLREGVSLVSEAMDLMAAAACAAVAPKPIYRARRPAEAADYMNALRLGQTERGSFVVSVISRVPPLLTDTLPGVEPDMLSEPFARRVTYTLAESLQATRLAVEKAAGNGSFDSFNASVPSGVSANLCDAIVGMAKRLGDSANLSVEMSWARTRPARPDVPRRVSFPTEFVPFLEEAARLFRERSPYEGYELRGIVTRLNRPEGATRGTATVNALVDDNYRPVSVELDGPDYDAAITSHREYIPFVCEGTLVKHGRAFALLNASHVRVDVEAQA